MSEIRTNKEAKEEKMYTIMKYLKNGKVIEDEESCFTLVPGINILIYSDTEELEKKIKNLKDEISEGGMFKIKPKIIDVMSKEQCKCLDDMIEERLIEKKPIFGLYVFFVYNNECLYYSRRLTTVTTVVFYRIK